MTFSYVSTDPAADNKDWVRMRVGDTSSGSYRLEDEEINALLADSGNKYLAAALAAESIGGQFAAKTDKTVGKLRIAQAQAATNLFMLARRLRAEASLRAGTYAGGKSQADKDTYTSDSDRVAPAFTRGQFDYTNTASSSGL